jgi:hypothetical protein
MGGRTHFLVVVAFLLGLPGAPDLAPGGVEGCGLDSIAFEVNGVAAPLLAAEGGDEVTVSFRVPAGCAHRLTFASFIAPVPAFDGSRLDDQALFSREQGTYGPGRHSMTVEVFEFPRVAPATCRAARVQAQAQQQALHQAVRKAMAADADYRERVIEEVREKRSSGERPNPTGPYVGSCEALGTNGAPAAGKPCDGCVGNTKANVPPGQVVLGTDANAGYRCDRNPGIGDGNPAHGGCPNFQLDFAYSADQGPGDQPRLIAAVFCTRTVAQCYVTDRTGSNAVVGPQEPDRRAE